MTVTLILTFIILHWIGDFILQTHEQSIKKSKSNKYLLQHTVTYSIVWIFGITFLWGNGHTTQWYILHSLLFGLITFICHTITDYFTSRWTSKLYDKGDIHNFFVLVGFDQILHYTQLILTYKLLIEN